MNVIYDFFATQNIASTMLYLCLTAFTGVMLGKVEFKSIKLGTAGVLFSGILVTHFGAPIDENALCFLRDFGLILYVYSIGISMGPRFFSSFKKDGILFNVFTVSIVLGSIAIAGLIHHFTRISPAAVAGLMCGAVANIPALGAVQQILTDQGANAAEIAETGMACAIAYPFGIFGVIFTMLLLRMLFRIKTQSETDDYTVSLGSTETRLQSVEITVANPSVFGKNIDYLKRVLDSEFAVSRIIRNGKAIIATDEEIIQQGDIICGASAQNKIEDLEFKIGKTEVVKIKDDVFNDAMQSHLAIINIVLTSQKLAGKTIEQIGIHRRYPANITRIFRSGIKILPTLHTTLELGDTVRVVGKKEILSEVKRELGDSIDELAKPNLISIFLGIAMGIILGSIPVFIPGLPAPAKLSLAGGQLLVAILLGYKLRIGKLSFYMTPGANLFMREFGIIIFLSCVGLLSGKNFVETFQNGGWQWMLYGTVVTFIPIAIVGTIARLMKVNYLKICGFIAGSMTNPPALEFANDIAPVQAQATAYAIVYPVAMFLRVLLAQIFVLLIL